MDSLSLAKGYAEALLALARARGEEGAVEGELRVLAQALRRDSRFRRALRDPDIDEPTRAGQVSAALQGVVGPLVIEHIATMVRHGHASLVGDMIERFLDLLASATEAVSAEVHAAVALTEDQKERLGKVLERRFGTPVRIHVVVDPAVGGGLLVKVGHELIDATVVSRLAQMRQAMRGNAAGTVRARE